MNLHSSFSEVGSQNDHPMTDRVSGVSCRGFPLLSLGHAYFASPLCQKSRRRRQKHTGGENRVPPKSRGVVVPQMSIAKASSVTLVAASSCFVLLDLFKKTCCSDAPNNNSTRPLFCFLSNRRPGEAKNFCSTSGSANHRATAVPR